MTRPVRRLLARLARHRAGVAMTEFALAMPFFLGVGLWGVEMANYAVTTMRVSQLAMHLADNASRVGDTSTLEDRKIYESDVNDLLGGAAIQSGTRLDFFTHGRAIISSLEAVPGANDRQYIHWQRCRGDKDWPSSYGDEGDGLDGGLTGMGPPGEEVAAMPGDAVIFVEVAYDYQPLISARFVGQPTIEAVATFNVRDDRDLSEIYQRNPASPDKVSACKA
jgi:hypothetical protein